MKKKTLQENPRTRAGLPVKTSGSMTKEQQMFVLNMIARFKTNPEIKDLLQSVHGVSIGADSLTHYRRDKFKHIVLQLRERYLNSVMEVPIAQKRIRLERAEELYAMAQSCAEAKERVDSSVKVLSFARDEIEGKSAATQFIQNNFNQFMNVPTKELLQIKRDLERKLATVEVEGHDASDQSG